MHAFVQRAVVGDDVGRVARTENRLSNSKTMTTNVRLTDSAEATRIARRQSLAMMSMPRTIGVRRPSLSRNGTNALTKVPYSSGQGPTMRGWPPANNSFNPGGGFVYTVPGGAACRWCSGMLSGPNTMFPSRRRKL